LFGILWKVLIEQLGLGDTGVALQNLSVKQNYK